MSYAEDLYATAVALMRASAHIAMLAIPAAVEANRIACPSMQEQPDSNETAKAEPVISRSPVESSQLKEIGYDAETQTLEVEFKSGTGGVYRYANFTQGDWDAFNAAESKGSYFIQNIKKNPAKYPYRRMS